MLNKIRFAKTNIHAKTPFRKNPTDSGVDLFPLIEKEMCIDPGQVVIVDTGITCEIPPNFCLWITNKSRNNFLIGGGICDSGYSGNILVKVINPTDKPIYLDPDKSFCQVLIIPVEVSAVEMVSLDMIHQEKTVRGDSGGIVTQAAKKKELAEEEVRLLKELGFPPKI